MDKKLSLNFLHRYIEIYKQPKILQVNYDVCPVEYMKKQYIEYNNKYKVEIKNKLNDKGFATRIESYIVNEYRKFDFSELSTLTTIVIEFCFHCSVYYTNTYYKLIFEEIKERMLEIKSIISQNQNDKIQLDFVKIIYLCELSRHLKNYKDNIGKLPFLDFDNNTVVDLNKIFEPIEDTKVFELFWRKYIEQSHYSKPEEDIFCNKKLGKLLKETKYSPARIMRKLSYLLKQEKGFSYDELKAFEKQFAYVVNKIPKKSHDEVNPDFIITQSIEEFKNTFNMIDTNILLSIIYYFSYNKTLVCDVQNPRIQELKCFQFIDGNILYGAITVSETLTIFLNSFLSGEYSDYWGFENEDHRKKLKRYHDDIARFMSYKLADILMSKDYLVPINDDGLPFVDIKAVNNIVFNDIDVLAINHKKKMIYNIEVKHIKSGLSISDAYYGQLKNSYYKKIKERENSIENNKVSIVSTLFNKESDYKNYNLKSCLVTTRPDFKGYFNQSNEEINKGIDYYCWNDFIKEIYAGNL